MKRISLILTVTCLVFALLMVGGCGSKEAQATQDCAGDCGMKAVSEDQMTQIDGKWYCGGCKDKAGHAHADSSDHTGHSH